MCKSVFSKTYWTNRKNTVQICIRSRSWSVLRLKDSMISKFYKSNMNYMKKHTLLWMSFKIRSMLIIWLQGLLSLLINWKKRLWRKFQIHRIGGRIRKRCWRSFFRNWPLIWQLFKKEFRKITKRNMMNYWEKEMKNWTPWINKKQAKSVSEKAFKTAQQMRRPARNQPPQLKAATSFKLKWQKHPRKFLTK